MDIYLARILERADGTLYVERKPSATTDDVYTAISHVWGDPSTIQAVSVDGIDGQVMLSPGKRNILSILRRHDICGTDWFWLDLFCIDQRPESRISIAEQLMAIPQIYKSSRVVKILIETPVCQGWAETATRVADEGVQDMAVFNEEELRHSRKCPNLLIFDPWFERLWTRQEGLYAAKSEVVVLNPVLCARLTSSRGPGDRWIAEGQAGLKRGAVEAFITDKLAYHGISTKERSLNFQVYLDLVYRGRIDIGKYGGEAGPHEEYSPFGEAWRSGRQTTKARDYVLAVFVDIEGYRLPSSARRMSFRSLLADAISQLTVRPDQNHGRFYFLQKVPSNMVDSDANHQQPWILEDPENITEAFDSFLGIKSSLLMDVPFNGYSDQTCYTVSSPSTTLEVQRAVLTRNLIPQLVEIWEGTADTVRHMVFAAPSGPCTGGSRPMQSPEDLLYRYLGHEFARSAVIDYCSAERFAALRPHGVVNIEKLEQLSDDIFERALQQFLVCLMCGTTLRTAGKILEASDIGIFSLGLKEGENLTSMLAIINYGCFGGYQETYLKSQLFLAGNGFEDHQGFLVMTRAEDRPGTCYQVGRTVIPKYRVGQEAGAELFQIRSGCGA